MGDAESAFPCRYALFSITTIVIVQIDQNLLILLLCKLCARATILLLPLELYVYMFI